jgi:pectate lyase
MGKKGLHLGISVLLLILAPYFLTGGGAATATTAANEEASYPAISFPVGWAAFSALGQNGTTGGAGGAVTHVYDKDTLKAIIAKDDHPAIIVIHGTLRGGPEMIDVKGNKTIVGADSVAYLDFGFYLRGSNIIIKNLDMMNGGFNPGDSEGLDCVSFGQDLHHVWIDHCTMHEALDGLVDPTRNARFVTVSYCYFHTQKTACLVGAGDNDPAALAAQGNADKSLWHYTCTFHHNYWESVYERCPRVRFGAVHVFNNFFDNNPKYAIGRGDRANIYSEANYFLNTHDAFAAYDDSANPGYVKDTGSLFEGDNGKASANPPSGAWAWDPAAYYAYKPHTAAWVKQNLKKYAGAGKSDPD